MPRYWWTCLLTCCLVGGMLGILAWAYDKTSWMETAGRTNLEMEFLVTDADSGRQIPDARIQVESDGGRYGPTRRTGPEKFELRTNAAGKASRVLQNNQCGRSMSHLRFTDTYFVYMPEWRIRVTAADFESGEMEFRGERRVKLPPEDRLKDRLPVEIRLVRRGGPAPPAERD